MTWSALVARVPACQRSALRRREAWRILLQWRTWISYRRVEG